MVASTVERSRQAPLLVAASVVALLGIAVWLRLAPLFADFPLGDGGLFWVMGRELRGNAFLPPMFTSFNSGDIPWMYPPLGLYEVAMLGGGLEWFRLVPAGFAVATLPAVWLLARALTNDRAAVIATIAYGLSAVAYSGLITGGGVTRAPGVLLVLLTMWAVVRGHVVGAGVLGGLVILTHPIAASYGAIGSAVLWATRVRSRRMLLAPLISLMIGALWFVPMLARHGLDSLLSSVGSRDIDLVNNAIVIVAGALNPPNLAFTVGAVGMLVAARRHRWDLIGWVVVTAFGAAVVDRWVVIPLAVLAGLAVDAAIETRTQLRSVALLGIAVVTVITGVVLAEPPGSLTTDEREMMAWAAAETPPDAVFAVIGYPSDGTVVEWFPALSQRQNLTTYQGREWIADGYDPAAISALERCRELACLPDANYYVLRPGCCGVLAAELHPVRPNVFTRTP